MRTASAGKDFSCVQLMRTLRDQLSQELSPLSTDERIRRVHQEAANSPLLKYVTGDPVATTQQGFDPDLVKRGNPRQHRFTAR